MATILLLRHGQSTANADRVLAGWQADVALTEIGRADAERVGRWVAPLPVARVVTSPLQRCRETTALAFPQAVPEVEDDLGECHYGGWTGRPLAELSALPLWKVVQDDPASAMFPPDASYRAESMQQMATRVLAALRRIDASVSAEHGDGALWAAVSHGDPIKSLVAEAAGAGLGGLQRVRVDPGSVSVIHVVGEKMMLLASNVTDGDLTRFLPSPEQPSEARGTVGGETG